MVGILIAAAVALALGLVGTPLAIRTFRRRGLGQLIQVDLPDAHQTKRGTPTMGGAVIIVGAVAGYLVVHLFSGGRAPFTPAGIMVVVTMVLLGAVGFVDDYLKIRNQRSLGLTKTAKFAGQALAAIVLGVGAWYWADAFRG
ncbi:MAG: phospho-N-acetylmuramoyl-pentapeptide-transferase, partial [Actinomycetota bacterium]|nr:phospho-N-acetylmuramoyl-pentapeptide-transferase [Actinomycetota bacterium]